MGIFQYKLQHILYHQFVRVRVRKEPRWQGASASNSHSIEMPVTNDQCLCQVGLWPMFLDWSWMLITPIKSFSYFSIKTLIFINHLQNWWTLIFVNKLKNFHQYWSALGTDWRSSEVLGNKFSLLKEGRTSIKISELIILQERLSFSSRKLVSIKDVNF